MANIFYRITFQSDCTFRFCVRNTPFARKDIRMAEKQLDRLLANSNKEIAPYAVILFGSLERGNRVFRYQVICYVAHDSHL